MGKSIQEITKYLENLIQRIPLENPEYTSDRSYGNYDDVFYDGWDQGEYHFADAVRQILPDLKELGNDQSCE